MAQCKRHPSVETNLRCGKCDDLICPKCLVQTPVGARCPSCARLTRIPTYNLTPVYWLRAVGAALVLAAAGGLAWAFVRGFVLSFGFLIGAGVGFLIGEGISLAVNRKRGNMLAVIGGLSAAVAWAIGEFIFGGGFRFFDLISLAACVFVSVTRLR